MNSYAKRQRQAFTAQRLREQADIPLEWNPLDGDGDLPEYVPPVWTGEHVGKRMVEAFKCLANLPLIEKGGGSKGAWPAYMYEWHDLLAQQQSADELKAERVEEHNRVRLMPSAQDISRMEIVISWAGNYLPRGPAVLVQKVAQMRSQDRDLEQISHRLRRRPHELRRDNQKGLDTIATGLRVDAVQVF